MKCFKIISLFFLVIMLGGCKAFPVRTEIGDILLVRAVGVDKCAKHPHDMTVFTVTGTIETGGAGQGGGKPTAVVLTTEGNTVMGALKKMQSQYDKTIFLGHTNYIIFGEGTVKDDLYKYFDFFERYYEIRLSAKIFIAKDCSANDILMLANNGELFISDRLDRMAQENYQGNRFIFDKNVIEIEQLLDKKFPAVAIPALVKMQREDDLVEQEIKLETDIEVFGYAVIKDFKLAGYIEQDSARGYNFLKNKAEYTVFDVVDPTELILTLLVANAKTEIIPEFNGDLLEGIKIKVKVKSSINEQQSRLDISKGEVLKDLEKQLSELIKEDIESAIDFSQEHNADFLGIDEAVRRKNPVRWERIKDNWDEIFPEIESEVMIDSVIYATHDIMLPSNYNEGD